MSEPKARSAPTSDRPPDDLKKERDAFIEQFFKKGAQLTEELLRENGRLRERQAELESENAELRAHLRKDDAIRELLTKISMLEREKEDLVNKASALDAHADEYSTQRVEVETELANLANLYVATSQLHASHSVRGVLRSLKELLAQLLGAGAFAVYFANDDGTELVALTSEGAYPSEIQRLTVDEGPIGSAFLAGEIYTRRTGDLTQGGPADPAAIIPLHLDKRTIGAIVIFRTLEQKTGFFSTDHELLRMLGAQAGPALVNAKLFTDAGRKVPPVQQFLMLED